MTPPTFTQLKIYFLSCLVFVSLFGLALIALDFGHYSNSNVNISFFGKIKTQAQTATNSTATSSSSSTSTVIGNGNPLSNLDDIDLLELKSYTSVPNLLLQSFKSTIDANVGRIDFLEDRIGYDNIQSIVTYKSILTFSGAILLALFLWEIIKVIIGKAKLQHLFVNLVMALVMPVGYIAIISTAVFLANTFIVSLNGNASFTDSVTGNINSFIQTASTSVEQQSLFQRGVNDIWNLISRTTPVTNVARAALKPAVEQYKLVTQAVAWGYFFMAILNWFSMFVVDWYLRVLVFVSPLVAVSHVNGWGNGFVKKFWAGFVDCIVAKLAFHFVYYLINLGIQNQLQSNLQGVNLGFGLLCICSFMALGAIVLKVRQLFDFIDTSYDSIESFNTTPITAIQNISSGAMNFGGNTLRTIATFKSLK
jgi:hypothetical protein